MTTTFVTGLFDLHEDRSKQRSADKYFPLFRELASSGVPIHAFVDPVQEPDLRDLPSNVTLEWLTQEDLTIAHRDLSDIQIPQTATPEKDTLRFHVLINSKIELVCRAMKKYTTPQQAWIDFGIFHVLRDRKKAHEQIREIARTEFPPGVYIPGCWNKGVGSFHSVNWRFCGGFFVGTSNELREFEKRNLEQVDALLARKYLTWEVNVWHQMELAGWNPVWYKGDHDNSILNAVSCRPLSEPTPTDPFSAWKPGT